MQPGSLALFVVEPSGLGEQVAIEYYGQCRGKPWRARDGAIEFNITPPTISFEQSEPNAWVSRRHGDRGKPSVGVGSVEYTIMARTAVSRRTKSEATVRLQVPPSRWVSGWRY